jgi:hypothetical protein
MSWKDEIVEEVRARRESYAARRADLCPVEPHAEIVNTDDARRS